MLANLQLQLDELYAERELLGRELGVVDAQQIILMVRNLEAQLADLYQTHGDTPRVGEASLMQLLDYVEELSGNLNNVLGTRSITLEVEDGKPRLRATWKDQRDNGDSHDDGRTTS